jgi:hypothetical protein
MSSSSNSLTKRKEIRGEEDRSKIQGALDTLWKWSEKWYMIFDLEKCKMMDAGRNSLGYEYQMSGVKLNTTDEERDVTKNLKPSTRC